MRLTPIKLQRLQANRLQVEVAREAAISRCRLSEIENGHLKATPDELARIAVALGLDVESLTEVE